MDLMGQVCHGVHSISCSLIHLPTAPPASLHLPVHARRSHHSLAHSSPEAPTAVAIKSQLLTGLDPKGPRSGPCSLSLMSLPCPLSTLAMLTSSRASHKPGCSLLLPFPQTLFHLALAFRALLSYHLCRDICPEFSSPLEPLHPHPF